MRKIHNLMYANYESTYTAYTQKTLRILIYTYYSIT